MSDSSFAGFFGSGGANRGAGPDAASSMEKHCEETNSETANDDSGRGDRVGTKSSGTDTVEDKAKATGVGKAGAEEERTAEEVAEEEAEEEVEEEVEEKLPREEAQ